MTTLRFLLLTLAASAVAAPHESCDSGLGKNRIKRISLGPRPYWLVDNMDEGPLKTQLAACSKKVMKRSDWSIGHRGGGTMQFPEHTRQSIMAGVRDLGSSRSWAEGAENTD